MIDMFRPRLCIIYLLSYRLIHSVIQQVIRSFSQLVIQSDSRIVGRL